MKALKIAAISMFVLAFFAASFAYADDPIGTKYYYYATTPRLLAAKILPSPDTKGNIYYHYIKENYNGTGIGRVDIEASATRAIKYVYWGTTTTVKIKYIYASIKYSDPITPYLSNLLETDTYYNNGRLESKALRTADGSGNVYYHYINENWAGQGYGRVDKTRRAYALNNQRSHTYSYFADSYGRLKEKRAFYDANWTKIIKLYTYYNDSANRLASETTFNISGIKTSRIGYYNDSFHRICSNEIPPNLQGNIYYHYLNESWNNQGYGRVDIRAMSSADSNGAKAYKFEYHGNTATVKTKYSYKTIDYNTNPFNPVLAELLFTHTYYSDGILESKTALGIGYGGQDIPIYINKYYHDTNNRLAAKFYESGYYNSSHTPLYDYSHYINEKFGEQNYGRIDIQVNVIYKNDIDGARAYKYEYYGTTSRIKARYGYHDGSTENAFNPVLIDLLVTRNYYNDSTNRMAAKTRVMPWQDGIIYYHYLNENWNNQGYGRVDTEGYINPYGVMQGTTYQYYGDTANIKTKNTEWSISIDDPLNPHVSGLSTRHDYTYYSNNHLESELAYYGNSSPIYDYHYYHYLNETPMISGNPAHGRKDIEIEKHLYSLNNTSYWSYDAYKYEYWGTTTTLKTKYSYNSGDYTDPSNPVLTGLGSTTCYYNDAYNRKAALAVSDSSIQYRHFLNEDLGSGTARVDIEVYHEGNRDSDGAVAYKYEYYNDSTYLVKTKYCYASGEFSDMFNPVLTNLVATYNYDMNGNIIDKAYYNDGLVATNPEAQSEIDQKIELHNQQNMPLPENVVLSPNLAAGTIKTDQSLQQQIN